MHARPSYFELQPSPSEPNFATWHPIGVGPEANAPSYLEKPVVAITSPYCFSACDTFVSALQTNALATVVGEGTGGGTGTPLVFELPNSGHSFRYSVVRGTNAKGEPLEGVGTLPDTVVEPTVASRVANSDDQLTKALEIVSAKLVAPGAPQAAPNSATAAWQAAQLLQSNLKYLGSRLQQIAV